MVCVLAKSWKPQMSGNIKRARRLLKKGSAEIAGHHISCGRTNSSELRKGPKNERVIRVRRAEKRLRNGRLSVSRVRRSIRITRSPFRPGDSVWIGGKHHVVRGAHNDGARVILESGRSVAASGIEKAVHTRGWRQL